jgi:hypothetical protein
MILVGHILSGGMDSKLWLWPGGVSSVELQGHSGPISQVQSLRADRCVTVIRVLIAEQETKA